MIEFELIDDSQIVEVDLIDDSETIEVGLIKEIDSYTELKDKPSINNVTLEGNKTLDELNIQQKGDYATNTYVNTELDKKVDKVTGKGLSTNDFTNEYKNNVDSNTSARHTHSNKTVLDNISSTDISNWNNKSTFSGDYNDLTNKPTIPNKTSQLTNDSGFINSSYHDDTKQDKEDNSLTTTNKTIPSAINEVNSVAKGANQALSYSNYSAMVTAFNGFASDKYNIGQNVMIVTVEVPDLWISSVESTSSTYTYVDDATIVSALQTNGYIQVGYYKLSMLETQKVDLTDYVTKTDYATSSVGGVVKPSANYGTQVASSGIFYGSTRTYEQYQDGNSNVMICKGTLENVITGKGLVSNTDYATTDTAGVIKTSSTTGAKVNASGVLYCDNKSYSDYGSASDYLFISKGTLENVITGKDLVSNTNYATPSVAGVVKVNNSRGSTMTNAGTMQTTIMDYTSYGTAHDQSFIGKGTLENVITGKNLVSNTDYATNSTGGVVKVSVGDYGLNMDEGVLKGVVKTYAQYGDMSSKGVVTKGTLENVITGKGLIDNTYYSDATTSTSGLMSASDKTKLNGIATGTKYYYGTCSTKNTTQAKVVVCPDFVLEEGATISVLFTNAQTYNGAPTLNVNGTGAITVQYKSGSSAIRYIWSAGALVDFTYNGSNWVMHRSDLATTTYYGLAKYSSSLVTTSTSLALTPGAINTAMTNIISGTPIYSSSSTYAVGDRVRYGDYVWECTTAITTAESWDETHWATMDSLQKQIDDLKALITNYINNQ